MIVLNPHITVLRREPGVELILERREQRLNGVLHQPRTGLGVLHTGQARIVGRARNANHAGVHTERRADVLTRHLAEVRELEVGEREAQRLDVLDRAKEGGRATASTIYHALGVAVLHRTRILDRSLVREQHGKGRRAIVRHHLAHVLRGLLVANERTECRRPTREAEHIGRVGLRHIEVAEVQNVMHGDELHHAIPVAHIVAGRVAVLVYPDRLHGLRVEGTQASDASVLADTLESEHGVAVAQEVHREPRTELTRRHTQVRVVEELLERVRFRHRCLGVAALRHHTQRHGRHDVGNGTDAGMDHGVPVEPLHANRGAVRLVLLRVGGADDLHPASRLTRHSDIHGRTLCLGSGYDTERFGHTRQQWLLRQSVPRD